MPPSGDEGGNGSRRRLPTSTSSHRDVRPRVGVFYSAARIPGSVRRMTTAAHEDGLNVVACSYHNLLFETMRADGGEGAAEAQRRHDPCQCVSETKLYVSTGSSATYEAGRTQYRCVGSFDVIFFRFIDLHSDDCALITSFVRRVNEERAELREAGGLPARLTAPIIIVNPLAMIGTFSTRKAPQMIALSDAGLPVPDTIYAPLAYIRAYGVSRLGLPIIVKGSAGSMGKSVFKASTQEQLDVLCEDLARKENCGRKFMAQRYVKNDGDFRVIVMGNRVLGAIRRQRLQLTIVDGAAAAVEDAGGALVDMPVTPTAVVATTPPQSPQPPPRSSASSAKGKSPRPPAVAPGAGVLATNYVASGPVHLGSGQHHHHGKSHKSGGGGRRRSKKERRGRKRNSSTATAAVAASASGDPVLPTSMTLSTAAQAAVEQARRYEKLNRREDPADEAAAERALSAWRTASEEILETSEGEFRNNVALGGVATVVELPESWKEVSVRASKVCGIIISGVDLIVDQRGAGAAGKEWHELPPLVLEVNTQPHFQGFEKATGLDVPREFIKYVASLHDGENVAPEYEEFCL